jgi:hypothetical protein
MIKVSYRVKGDKYLRMEIVHPDIYTMVCLSVSISMLMLHASCSLFCREWMTCQDCKNNLEEKEMEDSIVLFH